MIKIGDEVKGFNRLDLYFKHIILKKIGLYLMSAGYLNYTVKLYFWDRFLIEEYFDKEHEEITRITLACNKDLDKYMKDISLADLGVYTVL